LTATFAIALYFIQLNTMAESQNFANVVFSTGQEEILIEEVRNNPATMLLGGLVSSNLTKDNK
jgi:hypothetical protein